MNNNNLVLKGTTGNSLIITANTDKLSFEIKLKLFTATIDVDLAEVDKLIDMLKTLNNQPSSNLNKHANCCVAKGLKHFKCVKCGKDGTNYSNGVNLCIDCILKENLCEICGGSKK